MVLDAPGSLLRLDDLPAPEPSPGEVLLEVSACAVCRTDLHIVDGELDRPKLPLVLGHQIVARGGRPMASASRRASAWGCPLARVDRRHPPLPPPGRENLCDGASFTGYDRDGGYAELAVADERFCFPLPEGYPDLQAAPLLCAGLIGYRTLKPAVVLKLKPLSSLNLQTAFFFFFFFFFFFVGMLP